MKSARKGLTPYLQSQQKSCHDPRGELDTYPEELYVFGRIEYPRV